MCIAIGKSSTLTLFLQEQFNHQIWDERYWQKSSTQCDNTSVKRKQNNLKQSCLIEGDLNYLTTTRAKVLRTSKDENHFR